MSWNEDLGMLSRAGLMDAIDKLDDGVYTIVFADVDHLKALNSATGNHVQSNRYLKKGLEVRAGEIAGQLLGDEIVFVLAGDAHPDRFVQRIRKQLAGQMLTAKERLRLIEAGGDGRLSATFAWTKATKGAIPAAIEACSINVLAQKEARG